MPGTPTKAISRPHFNWDAPDDLDEVEDGERDLENQIVHEDLDLSVDTLAFDHLKRLEERRKERMVPQKDRIKERKEKLKELERKEEMERAAAEEEQEREQRAREKEREKEREREKETRRNLERLKALEHASKDEESDGEGGRFDDALPPPLDWVKEAEGKESKDEPLGNLFDSDDDDAQKVFFFLLSSFILFYPLLSSFILFYPV
jgi:hypothetical protein